MSNELNLNSFNLDSYSSLSKLKYFKNNDQLASFFYLKSIGSLRKTINLQRLEEFRIKYFVKNSNINFNEIQEQIHSLCGDLYFSKNKFGVAIEQYELCLQYNPGNIHAISGLANSFQSLGLNKLSDKKYRQTEKFYAWKGAFFDDDLDDKPNFTRENPDDREIHNFEFIPRNLLLNMGILYASDEKITSYNPELNHYKSKSIFEYLSRIEPSIDFPESYILIDINKKSIENNYDVMNKLKNNDDVMNKLKNTFPQLRDSFVKTSNEIKFDSKNYKINSKNLEHYEIFSCIPKNIIKSKKISALFFLYLESNLDNFILDSILKELNINIEPKNNNNSKFENLNKQIFLYWLDCIGDKKSLLSINKLHGRISEKKLIDETISSNQIIKALNREWDGYNIRHICNKIGNMRVAKLLTESLEDYVELYNSNKNVKEYTNFRIIELLERFEIRLRELSKKSEEIQKNKPKNWKKDQKTSDIYSKLKDRIHKLKVLK